MDKTLAPGRRWALLIAAAIGIVAALLPSTGFNIAMPHIMREFGVGHDAAHLVITGYMVASTVSMLPMPMIVRRIGLRRFYLYAVVLLALGAVVGSLSPSFPVLVATRVFQGAVAGTLIPLGNMLAVRLFPVGEHGKAIGILFFIIVMASVVAGPTLGGLLVDWAGWRAVPMLSVPFCIAGWLLGMRILPAREEAEVRSFDWVGMVLIALLTVAWPAVVDAAGAGSRRQLAVMALLACTLSVAFYRHCRRHPAAVIHRQVFSRPTVMLAAIVSLLQSFGMYASTYLIPAFLQVVQHLSATMAGAALLPAGLALAIMFLVGGILSDRHSPHRLVTIGLAVYTGGFAAIWIGAHDIGYVAFMVWLFLARLGQGLLLMALNQAAVHPIPAADRGEAAVLLSYAQQMGGVVGVSAIAIFTEWRSSSLGGGDAAMVTALCDGFGVITLALAASMAAAMALGSASRRSLKG